MDRLLSRLSTSCATRHNLISQFKPRRALPRAARDDALTTQVAARCQDNAYANAFGKALLRGLRAA
jgi:hypothetical protein